MESFEAQHGLLALIKGEGHKYRPINNFLITSKSHGSCKRSWHWPQGHHLYEREDGGAGECGGLDERPGATWEGGT